MNRYVYLPFSIVIRIKSTSSKHLSNKFETILIVSSKAQIQVHARTFLVKTSNGFCIVRLACNECFPIIWSKVYCKNILLRMIIIPHLLTFVNRFFKNFSYFWCCIILYFSKYIPISCIISIIDQKSMWYRICFLIAKCSLSSF